MIELATEKEHLAGANYIVTINSRRYYAAETVEEVEDIIGRQPFGSCCSVSSPAGLDVNDFIPY